MNNQMCPNLLFHSRKPLATLLLRAGHKIGKPAPLFAKLEQSFIDELKSKYGGAQETKTAAQSQTSTADLEQAVQAQADKVRELKASTKDKAVWQPEVTKLLALKKQLEEAKKTAPAAAPAAAPAPSNGSQSVQDLEKAIQEQGDKVRKLKGSTKDKAVWQPEVNVLLDLKKQLEAAQKAAKAAPAAAAPVPSPAASADAAQVKALEDKIAQQAEKVRTLKASGDAALWKPEVDILLGLKNQLAALTGTPATGGQGKGKKKK